MLSKKKPSLTRRLREKFGLRWSTRFRIKRNFPFGKKSKGRTLVIEKENGGIVTGI